MITDTLLPDQYTGNNATTVFARSFPVRNKNHLKVSLKNLSDVITVLTVDVDYTVQGVANSNPATWTITTTTAVPTGHVLMIAPNYPFEQSTDFQNLGGFYPQTHEDAFDYQMVILQQLREITDRCVQVPFGSTISQATLQSNIFAAETNALASANNAAASATSASNSATNASNSATSASNSATSASNSATNASNSATSASNSATSASNSATSASTFATNASNSATSASNSATSASNSATSASTSATNAAASATSASNSATSASNSATSASTSATNAAASATSASTSATNAAASASMALQSSIDAASYAITLWATGTNYAVGKVVVESNNLYRCLVAHTSGTFATDLSSSKWVQLSGTLLFADVREKLSANRTYYVSTTGSDSNNGLTVGTPFLTIQKALDVVLGLDLNKYTVSIQLADGTYTAGVNLTRPVLGGTLIIRGNSVAPSHVIISTTGDDAIKVSNNAVVTVIDMRLQTTTSGSCIFADSGGTVYFGNIDFHGCASAHIYATNQAFVGTVGNYAITGGAPYHILSENSATVVVLGRTITLTGTPNFSAYFVIVQNLALARLASNTFSGSATGARYRADLNAVISVSGASTTYLPGDSAGVTNFGGQYV